MNTGKSETEKLLEDLMDYFKVGTYAALCIHIGVARNTVSGWKRRDSVKSVRGIIYNNNIPIDAMKHSPNEKNVLSTKKNSSPIENTDNIKEKSRKLLLLAEGLGKDSEDYLSVLLDECKESLLAMPSGRK